MSSKFPEHVGRRAFTLSVAAVVGTVAAGATAAEACRNLNFENGTAYLFTEETLRGSLVDVNNVESRRAQFFGGLPNPVCDYQAELQTNLPNGYIYDDQSSYHNTCNYTGVAIIHWYQWDNSALPVDSTMNAFWKDDETEGFEKYCYERINGTDGS